jgi:hypothetical protein
MYIVMRQKEKKMKKILATMMLMLPLVTEAMIGDQVEIEGLKYEIAADNLKILVRPVDRSPEKMIIRDDVVEIKWEPFDRCANLREMIFESGSLLQRIEVCASSFRALRTIAIPSSVEIIGYECFAGYSNLCEVIFEPGSKLREIQGWAFFAGTAIRTIAIPSSVEIIGDWCFHRCANLREVTFESGSRLREIGGLAFSYTSLESIAIPSSVEIIGDQCFADNWSLRCLSFESGSQLRAIGRWAFGSDISVQGASHLSPAMSDRITQILDGK